MDHQEPLYEHRYRFTEPGYWGGPKETNFWMTDEEAAEWWAFGREGTQRMDETKRDRNAQEHPGYGFGFLGGKRG